jgi:acetyl-CoA carboxylase carboxyl transferase subunit alpha
MRITAQDLLEFGVADAIIPEPAAGAQSDLDKMSQNIKEYLVKTIAAKSAKDIDILQKERYTKFRKIGVFSEPLPAAAESSQETAAVQEKE